ncbi:hypothetical protein CSUI_008529, partial [Cystoisospora suis]
MVKAILNDRLRHSFSTVGELAKRLSSFSLTDGDHGDTYTAITTTTPRISTCVRLYLLQQLSIYVQAPLYVHMYIYIGTSPLLFATITTHTHKRYDYILFP